MRIVVGMNRDHDHLSTSRRLLLAAPFAGLALVPTAAGATSSGSSVSCGATVTTDVRLDADLVDCPGSGLIVGAPGITIDLAGHTIDGRGIEFGIDNPLGHDDVTIRRGTITDFAIGVVVFDTTGTTVERVAATGNLKGFAVQRGVDVELDRVVASGNAGDGIGVDFSEGTVVRRSTVVGNGQGGIVDRVSAGSRYERNIVTGNNFGVEISQTEAASMERNDVSGNDGDGIRLGFEATGVRLDRNRTFANTGQGLVIEEPGNAVTRHQSAGNGVDEVVVR